MYITKTNIISLKTQPRRSIFSYQTFDGKTETRARISTTYIKIQCKKEKAIAKLKE